MASNHFWGDPFPPTTSHWAEEPCLVGHRGPCWSGSVVQGVLGRSDDGGGDDDDDDDDEGEWFLFEMTQA